MLIYEKYLFNLPKGSGGVGMPYCARCGARLGDDAKFCYRCGSPVAAPRVETVAGEVRREEFQISGSQLVEKVKELIHEGNIRRIVILDPDGRTIIEIPLTVGVVGALLLPTLAALGVIAALVARCTIVVERVEPAKQA
jgi:hypothetical protein